MTLTMNDLRPVMVNTTAEDQDVAIVISCVGTSTTRTYTLTSATSLVLVDDGGTNTMAFATYTTLGALVDYINTLTYWRAALAGALRADTTASSVLLAATGTVTPKTGIEILWDTSACNHRTGAIGYEMLRLDDNGNTMAAGARTSSSVYGIKLRDPQFGNTNSDFQKIYHTKFAARLTGLYAAGTDSGAGAGTIKVYNCSQKVDGGFFTLAGPASGSSSTLVEGVNWADGALVSRPGERIVVRYSHPANLSSSTFRISGYIRGE